MPEDMEAETVRRVSMAAIERGWDELLRLAASIGSGRLSAALALGSRAPGDGRHTPIVAGASAP